MANEEMDKAASAAVDELQDRLADMNADQTQGALAVMLWIQQHYLDAGYKRLCRGLFDLLDNFEPA